MLYIDMLACVLKLHSFNAMEIFQFCTYNGVICNKKNVMGASCVLRVILLTPLLTKQSD